MIDEGMIDPSFVITHTIGSSRDPRLPRNPQISKKLIPRYQGRGGGMVAEDLNALLFRRAVVVEVQF